MKISIEFNKNDFWFGVYWKIRKTIIGNSSLKNFVFYICIIPCFPICIQHTKVKN